MGSMTLASLVRTYICAKDWNRPHLVSRVFSPTAVVEMVVKTDAIAFDPAAHGPEAIAEMLVRRFSRQYDNVYTFCLCEPPPPAALRLDCGWLVMMSDKQTRELQAGFGRYRLADAQRRGGQHVRTQPSPAVRLPLKRRRLPVRGFQWLGRWQGRVGG